MAPHVDILDQPESLKKPLVGSVVLARLGGGGRGSALHANIKREYWGGNTDWRRLGGDQCLASDSPAGAQRSRQSRGQRHALRRPGAQAGQSEADKVKDRSRTPFP